MRDWVDDLPLGIAAAAAAFLYWKLLARWAPRNPAGEARYRLLRAMAVAMVALWMMLGPLLDHSGLGMRLPYSFAKGWWPAIGAGLAFLTVAVGAIWMLFNRLLRVRQRAAGPPRATGTAGPSPLPERRRFLQAAGAALAGVPVGVAGYGLLQEREQFRVTEVVVPIRGLAADLDGLRLVHLSDIHLSPLLEERALARVVDMANELKGDIALVTGDLITGRRDPLDRCLELLSRLRADAGILGCLGNHEIYAGAERQATRQGRRLGIEFLRHQRKSLRFGEARINFAGVDYQPKSQPYLVGAERLLEPGALNILLSHNPDVFRVAARQGYDLTLAGHTHGGQITVEILDQHLNPARFMTRYVYGLYSEGSASIYVTRGIGTVGIPIRVGAPPEIASIRLCAT